MILIPLFTYCSIISSTDTETLNQRINSFERRAHEVIFKRKSNFPNNASIRSIQRRRLSTQVFNCVHETCVTITITILLLCLIKSGTATTYTTTKN